MIEDLSVRNMLGNHCLARAISDAAWSGLRSMLEYKCDWYGRDLIIIDRWYPSSKMCSGCGHLAVSACGGGVRPKRETSRAGSSR